MMFFRSQRFVLFSLVLFLGVLLLAKFVSPLYLKAQTATAGDSNSAAAGSGSVSCQISDVFDYVAPKDGAAIQASYIPASGTKHIGDLPNHVEYLNDTTFRQWSGSGNFIYAITGDTIRLAQDNVWGGQYCSTGAKAMYRLISNDGTIGSPQRKQSMSCGQSISSDHKLQPYIYDSGVDATKDPLHYSLNTCTVAGYESGLHTEAQLIYGGKAQCNPGVNGATVYDVAVFKNTVGPGVGEIYVYCKGFGLCALYDKLDSSAKNQPSAWDETTDLCDLQGGEDKNNYYEFNIQRESTDKVLNNFYDEYSTACLPKEEYTVGFENTQKCGQPGVYCPADWKQWNIPGKLSFTVDGKGYGLFRNEETVKSRVSSNTPTTRTESIESYLDMPNQNPGAAPTADQANNPAAQANVQAPIYSLTSFATQCNFVLNKLKAVHELCLPQNRVDTYSIAGEVSPQTTDLACGLNTTIAGTSVAYDQESMLAAFNNRGLSCEQLASSADKGDKAFLTDLLKVNVSMETAYRPAFIVAVTTFDDPNSTNNVTSKSDPEPEVGGKFQVIDYLEVKIPAIATDFLPPEAPVKNSDQMTPDRNSYKDPIQLTSDVLRSLGDQETNVKQQISDRALLQKYKDSTTKPFGKIIGDNGNMPIFCNVGGKLIANCDIPQGTGDNYQDQVPRALVEFINASGDASTLSWDSLPCVSNEAMIYGPDNLKTVAEHAKTILAQLKAEKAGPYAKKTSIETKITANVKDVTAGGNIETRTELYFVTPQRYELAWAQKSFLTFLNASQQQTLSNGATDEILKTVSDPTKFSPLLKSELGKTLSGLEKKPAYEIVGSNTVTNADGTTSQTPSKNDFDLRGLLLDTSDFPDTQSIFWKVAGQVASLPTRMMALVTTRVGSPINDYTRGCTGNFATENWLTGKCLKAADVDVAAVASPSAGTTSNMCIEAKISDPDTLKKYGDQLKGYLAQPSSKDLWYRYYSGYRADATEFLFESTPMCGDGSSPCFNHVIDTAIANHINPYLAIAIALNEDGGLKATADGLGPHFGCGLNPNPPPKIVWGLIENKLTCMVGAFNDYETHGLNSEASLVKYGYDGGQKQGNLSKIIGIISLHSYAGKCETPQ